MAFIEGTDIPSELLDAWNAIFNFGSKLLQDVIQVTPRTVSRPKYSALAQQSLLVLWAPLYDSFDSTRRGAWDAYWGILPFGSHSGANGWPGSGFSAFIYVNAPIYKVGGDILYDPPASLGPELLTNRLWTETFDGWEQDPFNYQFELAAGNGIIAPVYDDQYYQNIWQFPTGLTEGVYFLQLTIAIPDGISFYSGSGFGFGSPSSPESILDPLPVSSNGFTSVTYQGYRSLDSEADGHSFAINLGGDPGMGNIYVYSASLKKVIV